MRGKADRLMTVLVLGIFAGTAGFVVWLTWNTWLWWLGLMAAGLAAFFGFLVVKDSC